MNLSSNGLVVSLIDCLIDDLFVLDSMQTVHCPCSMSDHEMRGMPLTSVVAILKQFLTMFTSLLFDFKCFDTEEVI